MKKILHITKADIKNAGGYMDCNGCLACTAIRRTFKLPADAIVRATGYEVGFELPGKKPVTFAFSEADADRISDAYSGNGKPFRVKIKRVRPEKFGFGGWVNFLAY